MTNFKPIKLEGKELGKSFPVFIIAEVGCNFENDFKRAKEMIKAAASAGADAIKFQTFVPEKLTTRDAPKFWEIEGCPGETQYEEFKEMFRLSFEQYKELKKVADDAGIIFFSTPSDEGSADVLEKLGVQYALLHCTSIYPTPYDKIRLGALGELKAKFPNAVIGLSDHSIGNYTGFAAIALGASILEKHFTSDINWPGPDVPISINPQQLQDLIIGCNAIHKALGGKKEILKEEKPTIDFAYACVVSIEDIKKGETFTTNNIWVKRPGTGDVKAVHYSEVLGKKAQEDVPKDTLVKGNPARFYDLPEELKENNVALSWRQFIDE